MLAEICDFVHNYFELQVNTGTFTVANGVLNVSGLRNGQRFRIQGSALNDGIYTYTDSGYLDADSEDGVTLSDETFTGSVSYMGVPKSLLVLSAEISAWADANSAALNSPYTSESFGGYSYTKATGAGTGGSSGAFTWQDMYRTRLNAYRKIG